MKSILLFLILVSASFAFTIESYENEVKVLPNGDLEVFENITFILEEQYNEGYRSIRPADAPSTSSVKLESVHVNGGLATSGTQVYDEQVEIFWKNTYVGKNVVELRYVLDDKVEVFDDYARVCYEHFGANWQSTAKRFNSKMTLPEATSGTDMHFEIYSSKKGTASTEGLSIVSSIDNVPPGNYVGGCYLFDKNSVTTGNLVNGSAYDILTDERKSYGSEAVLVPGNDWQCICFPLVILSFLGAAYMFVKKRRSKLPESILPPGKENPAVVAAIVRNSKSEKDILAATLISMINKGFIEIVELEKKGETSAHIKRERTILIKKKETGLAKHEQAVMKMLFNKKKEVDLDAMAKELKSISKTKAKAHHVPKALKEFNSEIDDLLATKTLNDDAGAMDMKRGLILTFGFFVLFALFMCSGIDALFGILYFLDLEKYAEAGLSLALVGAFLVFGGYTIYKFLQPAAPKGYEKQFEEWDAFARGLKSSRIKEYPPASVAIWGEILVYATALGLADKVKKHLSELDEITLHKIEELDKIRETSVPVFLYARQTSNLKTYGNRQGFSSRSSGGWSSGGGGGFSGGGSSGGGGFR
jgi:uncharacterized membrane protein